MPNSNEEKSENFRDTLDALKSTTSAIAAFNSLIGIAFQSGNNFSNESYGIGLLLERQCDDLKDIRISLREQIDEIREGKLQIRDVATVAQWAGVGKGVVSRVLSIATGIELPDVSDNERLTIAQDAWIYTMARAMNNPESVNTISNQTGVNPEKVKKVLEEALMISHPYLSPPMMEMDQ